MSPNQGVLKGLRKQLRELNRQIEEYGNDGDDSAATAIAAEAVEQMRQEAQRQGKTSTDLSSDELKGYTNGMREAVRGQPDHSKGF